MAIKTLKSWANISLHSGGADCQLFSLCSWAHTHCHRTMAITILVLYNFSRAATQHPLRELAALYFASFILLCRCHYYYLLLGALFCCVAFEKFFGLSGGAVKTPLTSSSLPPFTRMRKTCGNYSGLSKIDGVLSCEWKAEKWAGAWQVDLWVQIIGTLRACNQC